jgi:ribosomal protein L11 methyltransferase
MFVKASTRRKVTTSLDTNDAGGSWKLTLPCTRAEAEAINGDIPEFATMDSTPVIITREPDERKPHLWQLDAYFEGRPDDASIAFIQSLLPSARTARPILEKLPDEDWVTVSQAGLEPVHAGRFYVHTSTSTALPPAGAKHFIIDASLAFGTGGHATTTGCLTMLDALKTRGQRFDHIVDIGTGTGLLAFAASHLWPRAYVTASDIDPISVDVAADNAIVNGVTLGQQPGRVALCAASGTDHEMIQRRAPYDLIIANILAGPLIELAPASAAIARDGGTLILAGLLGTQINAVAKAYRAQGFRLAESNGEKDWPCLRFVKRTRVGWKRPLRTTGRTSQAEGDFGTW